MRPLQIVIPMAGRGTRFASAGYRLPKPLIDVGGKPMIRRVIENLRPARPHHFIFLCLAEHLELFDLTQCLREWAPGCQIVAVDRVTEGAACTVLLARDRVDAEAPLMLANSDQWVDTQIDDYLGEVDRRSLDGMIMTLADDDPKWSFVRVEGGLVREVREKQAISREATVGVYNFARAACFFEGADEMIADDERVNGEFYVAPVYNRLIRRGLKIGAINIGAVGDVMWGLGTPEDLSLFLARPVSAALD